MNRVFVGIKKLFFEKPIALVLILYAIGAATFVPQFASPINFRDILVQSSDLIILACGMTFVILNGGIDFSAVAVLGLASIMGASVMNLDNGFLAKSPYSVAVAILVMMVIGLVIGAINGLSVVKLKMPSFIATMATSLVFSGLALYYTKSETIANLPRAFNFIGNGYFLGIPFPIIAAALVVLITHYVLGKTTFGRSIYAIGTNPKTSFIAGLPVKRIIFMLFIINGFLAAVGAIVMTARMGSGMPALGQERLIDIVVSVIIGGTSIFGGSGTILGTVFGALFITVLNNSLNILGISWFVINILKGLFLLLIALLDAIRRNYHA